ncbi:MAG: FkbM family methyltransferase [Sphingomonas sp.]|nr:FkbM family methyltransferase [Sphingomonas sp.]
MALFSRMKNSRAVSGSADVANRDEVYSQLMQKLQQIEQKIDHVCARVDEMRLLVGPFAVTLADGSLLTQTVHGVKFFLDPDDLIITPQMIIYRQWEDELSALFHRLCNPETVLVDVGANIGYFTVLGANLIGNRSTGQVFSFEPNPKLAALARRNLEINWSMAPVTFHETAVADFCGSVTLHIPPGHGANASLSPSDGFDCEERVVSSVRLDDVLPEGLVVDLLKVDVEGHEAGVLRGAREVIARSPNLHLVMEWSQGQMRHAGIDHAEIIAMLDGFTPHRIEIGSDPLAHPESFEWLMAQEYTDALFVRL